MCTSAIDIIELVRQMAVHLDGWTGGVPYPPYHNHVGTGELVGPHGMRVHLILSNHNHDRGRILVYGVWPRAKDGTSFPSDSERPVSITVSAERPVAQLAADLQRRYLAAFASAWHAGCKQRDQWDSMSADMDSLAVRLAAITSDKPSQHSPRSWSIYQNHCGHGDGRIDSPDSVRLTLSLDAKTAESVLELIKAEWARRLAERATGT